MACHASVSRVPTEISGSPAPKHRPFAVDTPTLRPVYDPGPFPTTTALQPETFRPVSSRTSLTNTAVSEACALGSELMRSHITFPSRTNATEQREVEVSMRIRFSIIYGI